MPIIRFDDDEPNSSSDASMQDHAGTETAAIVAQQQKFSRQSLQRREVPLAQRKQSANCATFIDPSGGSEGVLANTARPPMNQVRFHSFYFIR